MKAEYSPKYAHIIEPYIELVAWACSEMFSLFNQVLQNILSLCHCQKHNKTWEKELSCTSKRSSESLQGNILYGDLMHILVLQICYFGKPEDFLSRKYCEKYF